MLETKNKLKSTNTEDEQLTDEEILDCDIAKCVTDLTKVNKVLGKLPGHLSDLMSNNWNISDRV